MKKRIRYICALLIAMTSMNMLPGADAVRTTANENRALLNRLSAGTGMPLMRKSRPFAASRLRELPKSSGAYSEITTVQNLLLSRNLLEAGLPVLLTNAEEISQHAVQIAPAVAAESANTPKPDATADIGLNEKEPSEPTVHPEQPTPPQETTVPEATAVPQETTVPEATAVPQETTVPEATAVPQETTAPEATAVPQETTAPEATAVPQETTVPEATALPQETTVPEATAVPQGTLSPQETFSPEGTHAPEETVRPEDILNPQGSEDADTPAEPEATLAPEEMEEVVDSKGVPTVVIKKSYPSAWYGKIPTDGQGMPIPMLFQGQYKQPVCISDGEVRSVATSGCGATSVSMVVAYLTGNVEQTPYTLFKLAMERDHYHGAGLSHQTLSMLAAEYGVHSQWVANDAKDIIGALDEGKPVIAHMGPGVFTKGGHYIVLRGVTDEGLIVVNDPGSQYRTGRAYPIDLFLQQARMNDCFMVCWVDDMPGSESAENARDRVAVVIPLLYVEPDGDVIEPENVPVETTESIVEPEGETIEPDGEAIESVTAESEEQVETVVEEREPIRIDQTPVKDKHAKPISVEMVIEEIDQPEDADDEAAAEPEIAAETDAAAAEETVDVSQIESAEIFAAAETIEIPAARIDQTPVRDKRAKPVSVEMVIEETEPSADAEPEAAETDVPVVEDKMLETDSSQPIAVDELLVSASQPEMPEAEEAESPTDADEVHSYAQSEIAPVPEDSRKAVLKGSRVNMREQPDLSEGRIIAVLEDAGSVVEVLDTVHDEQTGSTWYRISVGDQIGYVYGEYLGVDD